MRELAPGLYKLSGFPPNAINVYLMGDVLVDAGTRHSGPPDLAPARAAHRSRAHALTHAHPDHQGASKEVCERLGIPLWCGERDVARDGDAATSAQADHRINRLHRRASGPGPPHQVDARAARGRRGGRLRGPRRAGPLAGPRRLLARVRPRARARRRPEQHERAHRHPGPARAAARSSRPTRRATASRRGGSRRSSRRWSASATGRRCATRDKLSEFAARLPRDAPARVGFIGLGIMGSRMAANLRRAGFELVVWNRTAETARALGGRARRGGRRLARRGRRSAATVVITMVVDGDQVESVLLGRATARRAPRDAAGPLCIDMSTIGPPPRGGSAPRWRARRRASWTRP